MKGLSRVVVGSIAGGLLGAAAFFAVDGLMPTDAKAGCYTEQCDRYGKYQDPYSKYQDPYGKYQDKYSSEYIPSCKKTGAC